MIPTHTCICNEYWTRRAVQWVSLSAYLSAYLSCNPLQRNTVFYREICVQGCSINRYLLGKSINDVQRFLAIFDLPNMSNNVYLITTDIQGLFWTPLPTLKSDVIYGRSQCLRKYLNRRFLPVPKIITA